jgi:hypothetical protein
MASFFSKIPTIFSPVFVGMLIFDIIASNRVYLITEKKGLKKRVSEKPLKKSKRSEFQELKDKICFKRTVSYQSLKVTM